LKQKNLNEMKKIKNLTELQTVIDNRYEVRQDFNGRITNVNIVTLLSWTLLETIKTIKEGNLYYIPEM
jgi:hypothetical protein